MQLNPDTFPIKPDADARVSVIIPLYNHQDYIQAALESVFSQSLLAHEIIVIDDGSADASAEKVRRLCVDHPEIIFWSWPNQGAHHTLNAAILRATGDFVAILNSDDRYHPQRLAACLELARSDPAIDVVATGMDFIDDQGNAASNPWYENALSFFRQEGDLSLGLFNANLLVTTSNLFIRRSIFDSIGYFAPLRYTHDLELCLRLILGKRQIRFLDRPLLSYRLHGANTIAESKAREDVERAAVFAFFLYRLELTDGSNESWLSRLERYSGVLGQQELLEMVERFLIVLNQGPDRKLGAVTDSLPAEFLNLLARLGADWVAHRAENPLLAQFVAVRDAYLQSRQDAGGDPQVVAALTANISWLTEQCEAWQRASEEKTQSFNRTLYEIRTENSWLTEQRDAWQRTSEANTQSFNRTLDEMRTENSWLTEQRDAWQKSSEENTLSFNRTMDEMRSGTVWLTEQRDTWKGAAETEKAHSESLQRALDELRTGNAWLLEQRDAWQMAASNAAREAEKCHEALHTLLRSRLFRLLLRAGLLDLSHLPPDLPGSATP
ncbi:MAG: glycosyltransferase [Rhodocyclaceae bacterium]|nr:MAG: glycosyltransferase [Rhodocyclaceae bacterium]